MAYLVHGAGVGDGISVLDDGHGFTSQDRLVNTDRGGVHLDESDVSGDFVTHCNKRSARGHQRSLWVTKGHQRSPLLTRHLNHITGDDLAGAHLLHAALVSTHDLAHLRLVLLQSLDGRFGIPLLRT